MSEAIRRDLSLAQRAYEQGNTALSRAAHTPKTAVKDNKKQEKTEKEVCISEPGHTKPEDSIRKCAINGGFEGMLCGIVLVTALSSTAASANLDASAHGTNMLASGFACLLALAIAFGARDFIRVRSDIRHYQRERARETWELANFPEGEAAEMVELYVSSGISEKDAESVIHTLAKYEEFFVDLMMSQELRLVKPDGTACNNAMATVLSFLSFGALPFVVHIAAHAVSRASETWELDGTHVLADNAHVFAYVCHPFSVAVLTAIVTTAVLALANVHILPTRSRLSTYAMMFGAVCVSALMAYAFNAHFTAYFAHATNAQAFVSPGST